MPTSLLHDRGLLLVSGPDAETFLQNIVTTDLDALTPGEARPGALLSPQGKILFDFLVSRAGDQAFRLELRDEIADDLIRRLMMYRLRAKVQIEKLHQQVVEVRWGDDSRTSQRDSSGMDTVRDVRFGRELVLRRYGGPGEHLPQGPDWHQFRIGRGVAESGADYPLGDAFPHDVLLDRTGGVGFRKGCYVGQEVVSRMQHRGTARRRVLLASGDRDLPPSGTEIMANGRSVGVLGSSQGRRGLAIARIDRVKDALDRGFEISAAGVPLALAIPDWAGFTFPEAPAQPEEA